MKKLIFALGVLFSVNAFAQEMDTTYAVTDDGETVGLVHKRGEIPVVPEGMKLVDEASVAETAEQPVAESVEQPAVEPVVEDVYEDDFAGDFAEAPAPQAVRVNRDDYSKNPRFKNLYAQVDSIAYYQDLVDRYTQSGNKMKLAGTSLLVGGVFAGAVGILMMYASDNQDDIDEGIGMFLSGYVFTIAGVGAATTGIVLKAVGGSKTRKARRYNEKLMDYKERNEVSLKVAPVVNPVKKSLGGALALNF